MLEPFKKQFKEKGEVYLRVKVRTGAGKTAVREVLESEEGKTIKIDVAAQPVKGRANEALVKYLREEFLAVNVKILSGAGEKIKLLKISRAA